MMYKSTFAKEKLINTTDEENFEIDINDAGIGSIDEQSDSNQEQQPGSDSNQEQQSDSIPQPLLENNNSQARNIKYKINY